MSDINMILCVLMIVASVLNVAAFVHWLYRPSELREAIERATSEDPKNNFFVYILNKCPDACVQQGELLKEYAKWKRETRADLYTQLVNAHYIVEAISLGRPETPPDER